MIDYNFWEEQEREEAEYEAHQQDIAEAYQQGRADREAEIIENINGYTDMLIEALNDEEEKPILHEALAITRADEIRVRKLIIEQLKEQTE